MKLETISFTLNGRAYQLEVPANRTLLDLIREDLGFTGTKRGCEIGQCGACTVLLDGVAVNSCLVMAPQAHGKKITTVEGLMENGKLHPLQEAFLDNDAVHCGFCSPGMLMSALALFNATPNPTDEEIKIAISGNLCRCTGYWPILNAMKQYRDTNAHQATP
jgi:aerobic-type carbon monoxide dehydrogenase small subunit (CoxS/CutS family)